MRSSTKLVSLVAALSTLALTTAAIHEQPVDRVDKKPVITVYKDPGCGCCKKWVEHLIKHGYQVNAKDTPDMQAIKTSLGVPDKLAACHTAVVNGYLIEGHVPAEDIERLLTQKPKIAGIAVPGMPAGSPGMEGPTSQHYQVFAFDKKGQTKVFASH